MAYAYTPTYYSSLQDSITSICKTILPFSFKKRRLPAIAEAEKLRSKQQSDNLKWQQDSFHQILNLMGLCKEGIIHEDEVSAFRAHILEILIASPMDYEQPVILRDKLIFLQELLYSKCISEDEYHASKRPLLQRLAVQGAEIGEKDVIVGLQKNKITNEVLSAIDFKEKKCLVSSESSMSKNKFKEGSTSKKIKGATSVFGFVTPDKYGKLKDDRSDKDTGDPVNKDTRSKDLNVSNVLLSSTENPFWIGNFNEKESESKSILMMESLPEAAEKQSGSKKGERKPFRALFQREQKEEHDDPNLDNKDKGKVVKKTWGFDGFKKWKKNNSEDHETAPLSLGEKSDDASYNGGIVGNMKGDQADANMFKKKVHTNGSPGLKFVNEAFGDNMKKEISRSQTEINARSPHVKLLDDQTEKISTLHPVDDAELKNLYPKLWYDQNGNAAMEVERKEFKNHVEEKGGAKRNSKRWTTFDDDENSHPNLFASQDPSYSMKQARFSSSRTVRASFNSSIDKGFKYNPFFDV